ncbi:MAG: hypothetical protein ACYTFO_01810 [Planctomycetota bacterium]|jgi:hypothetical protein
MSDQPEHAPSNWDLDDWEQALTIHVGATYICRECGNVVMVTRGGIGMMDHRCCGKPMELVAAKEAE